MGIARAQQDWRGYMKETTSTFPFGSRCRKYVAIIGLGVYVTNERVEEHTRWKHKDISWINLASECAGDEDLVERRFPSEPLSCTGQSLENTLKQTRKEKNHETRRSFTKQSR